jgi:hypothetical protein
MQSAILLLGRAPLAQNVQRPPITGVPGPFIDLGVYSLTRRLEVRFRGQTRLRRAQGRREAAHLDSEQFRSAQNNSGLPKDLPIRSVAG